MSFSLYDLNVTTSSLAAAVAKNNAGMITIPISCNALFTASTACYNTKTLTTVIFNPNDILMWSGGVLNSFTGGGTNTVQVQAGLTAGVGGTNVLLTNTANNWATSISGAGFTLFNTTTVGVYATLVLPGGITSANLSGYFVVWRQSLI